MAITTETYYDVVSGGITRDRIGLSDTLDNYTAEEIKSHVLCGCRDKLLGGNLGLYDYGNGSYDVWNTGTPFATGTVDETYMHMLNGSGDNSTADLDGRYCGTVLLTDDLSAFPLCVTSNNIANFKLITELNIKSYCMNISATLTQKGGIGATQLSDKTNTLYCVDIDLASLTYRYGTSLIEIAVNLAVVPYHVFEIAGELFLINGYKTNKLGFSCHLAPNRNGGMEIYPISSNADADSYSLAFNNLGFGDDYSDYSDDTYAWAYGFDTVNKFGSTDAELWYQCYFGILGFDVRYYYTSYNQMMMQFANTGLYFKIDGVIYKPLISDNVVYGYTDNLDTESDIDNWERDTKHNIPVTPPTPPTPSGDDPSDDQSWGGAYSGAGVFSKFYLCTATDLANLRTWFGGGGSGDPIPDGFDPMGQVLGLLQYPVSIAGTALAPDEITFRSGKTILHTGVSADRSTGGFLHIDCGSVEIPRRMQQRGVPFLDFETSLEIYVPFCGTAPLDVQTCVGTTLTCDIYVATATGDVSAVIAAGGHPVAYMSGNMAESLPISSSGYGMYLAACKSTWGNGVSQVMNQLTGGTTSTIKNVNQAALNETLSYGQTGGWGQSELLAESYNNPAIGRGMAGAASAKGVAAIGLTTTALNIANAASTGYEQYQRVKNASYTSVSGSFTSCAAWNYPFTPYVKITRPHKQIPSGGRGDYKHTAGIPLVETRTLSGAPGLTTCVNPDVSGISNATAQEKDIIYRALVNGVIV